MPDYSKGLIYRIDCNETGECYIGSTTQGLANRIAGHRKDTILWKKGTSKKYWCSFPIIERGNYTYEMIIEYTCNRSKILFYNNFNRVHECFGVHLHRRQTQFFVCLRG